MDKQDEQDKNRAILSILCIHFEIRKRPSTIAQSFLMEELRLLDGLGMMFGGSLRRKSNERSQQRNNRGHLDTLRFAASVRDSIAT